MLAKFDLYRYYQGSKISSVVFNPFKHRNVLTLKRFINVSLVTNSKNHECKKISNHGNFDKNRKVSNKLDYFRKSVHAY